MNQNPSLLVSQKSSLWEKEAVGAVLNHNYWKLPLFPRGSDFWAKVFSLAAHCARDGTPAERPARRRAELPEFQHFPRTAKFHHVTYNPRQSTPFEGGQVSPQKDPRKRATIHKHVLKILRLSIFSSFLKTKFFCFKSSEMTGLMKMGTYFFNWKSTYYTHSTPPCPRLTLRVSLPQSNALQPSSSPSFRAHFRYTSARISSSSPHWDPNTSLHLVNTHSSTPRFVWWAQLDSCHSSCCGVLAQEANLVCRFFL